MKPVVNLTAAARVAILEASDQLPKGTQWYLRVGIKGGGCSGYQYEMDTLAGKPTDRDIQWREEDAMKMPSWEFTVAVDPISAQYLRGTTIDYVEKGLVKGFTFSNPNAKHQCGCGQSFSA